MNVLEKILQEIKKLKCNQDSENQDYKIGYASALSTAEEIIRSYIDEVGDMHGKRLIDANVHTNDDPYILLTINENGVAEKYDDTYDITIHCESEEEQDRVSKILENYHGWIPVEERLPEENNKLLYDMQLVTLEDGEVCLGVYHNREDEWWTRRQEGEEWYTNKRDVVAWQPLPEAYHPKQAPAAERVDLQG